MEDNVDRRLYLPDPKCDVKVQRAGERAHCYMQNPGEEYFHRIVKGEIYIEFGTDKYCLNCAEKHGLISRDRLFWQRQSGETRDADT